MDRIVRIIFGFLFTAIGVSLAILLEGKFGAQIVLSEPLKVAVIIAFGLGFAVFGYGLAPRLFKRALKMTGGIEKDLQKMPTQELVGGAVGLIFGLIIASLISGALSQIPYVGPYLPVLTTLMFGYIGVSVGVKKQEDLLSIFTSWKLNVKENKETKEKIGKGTAPRTHCKVLDTSVIIDGRIADICSTGFIEGNLVVPNFVLEELRHIADSSDSMKRNRGRRGLDVLNKIRKELKMPVIISDMDFEDIAEVDSKLVKLAQVLDGYVLTNDYNLNKVAELQGVKVLNINELSNAIKPIVLPGEEMRVIAVKEGKEQGQGIAYLDDGTMIVVEDGQSVMGEKSDVVVTSIIQTAAGRMIFAKLKEKRKGEKKNGKEVRDPA